MPVSEIAAGVHTLEVGRGITRSNVYFVCAGSTWVLIDTGSANCGQQIQEAADFLFGPRATPEAILLTHDHPDHAGSTGELAQKWGCPVYLHPDELPLATVDEPAFFARYRRYTTPSGHWTPPPLDRWIVLPVMHLVPRRRRAAMLSDTSFKNAARALDPAAGVPGLPDWRCIPTPGHTPGHVAFFRPTDRVLIAGDAVVTVNLNSPRAFLQWARRRSEQRLSGPPWYTTWSWRSAKESVAFVERLDPLVVASGHGLPMSGAGVAQELRALGDRYGAAGIGSDRAVSVRRVGTIVLGLSACGYPLTQVVMRRLGRTGAGLVEAVCVGLTIRDGALIASGAPRRLRRTPAVLLWLEFGAGIAATVAGLPPLLRPRSAERAGTRPGALERVRRTALATLFGLHTIRFRIYMRPAQGRRPAAG